MYQECPPLDFHIVVVVLLALLAVCVAMIFMSLSLFCSCERVLYQLRRWFVNTNAAYRCSSRIHLGRRPDGFRSRWLRRSVRRWCKPRTGTRPTLCCFRFRSSSCFLLCLSYSPLYIHYRHNGSPITTLSQKISLLRHSLNSQKIILNDRLPLTPSGADGEGHPRGAFYPNPASRPPSSLTVSVGVVPVVEPARSVASRLRLVGLHAVGLIGLALCNASLVGVPSFASSFPVLCVCHCVLSVVFVSVYCIRMSIVCQGFQWLSTLSRGVVTALPARSSSLLC